MRLAWSFWIPTLLPVAGYEYVNNTCPIFNDFHLENVLKYKHHRHQIAPDMPETPETYALLPTEISMSIIVKSWRDN